MTDYSKTYSEHLRLSILRILDKAPNYSANDSLLTDALPAVGFEIGRDRVRTALAWLEEQGLISLEKIDRLTVATLTGRGIELVAGKIRVPGVKRPTPG